MTCVRTYASLKELDMPIGDGLDNPDRLEWLRTETHDDFRVDLWDTNEPYGSLSRPHMVMGRSKLAYRLCWFDSKRAREIAEANDGVDTANDQVWEIIFAGEDFSPSPMHSIDSDLALGTLVGFLSAKPGDVEDEYFKDYTERQLAFAEEHGELLSLWASELETTDGERLDRLANELTERLSELPEPGDEVPPTLMQHFARLAVELKTLERDTDDDQVRGDARTQRNRIQNAYGLESIK